ncbi:MAG: recombinase family protein [Ruminococcus sp.]|nr:recombinase family protein [Ruminococcus sp.]
MPHIAIYARKSVFREDSVSIESQIEMCRYEARGEKSVIYQDNGFSGKNTDRPDFQKMMNDIKSGKISKVIVYKLDRISRSILDFSEMMDVFQKYGVDFVSATEKFDTSSPMGRAMLNICIVFAQLERETIQQRVADAYASRSKMGLFMGGHIPYGFTKVPLVINGINSSMFEAVEEEADDIRRMFDIYSRPTATLGDVLRELTEEGRQNRRGKYWSTARLSEIMRNPIYVRADYNVYSFFKKQRTNICSPMDDFNGQHGCYLFSGGNTNRKTWDLQGQNLVIAPHSGLIEADKWLFCRRKLMDNHRIKTCKPKNSWLAGVVKCGCCGYAVVVKKTHGRKYFICSGRASKICTEKLPTIYVESFENQIKEKIGAKLDELYIHPRKQGGNDEKLSRLRAEIQLREDKIKALVDKLPDADPAAVRYINETIGELDSEKSNLNSEAEDIIHCGEKEDRFKELVNVISKWEELSFDEKRSVAVLLISKITVYPDNIEINWRV